MKILIAIILTWSLNAKALVNGKKLQGRQDLVRLEFNNRDSICSGFFLSPRLIVTSAHCLYSWRDGKEVKLTKIVSASDEELDVDVIELIPHPNYSSGWVTHDVAVIKVKSFTGFKGDYLLGEKDIPLFGKLIYYGAGKIDMDKKIYGRSWGEANFLSMSSYVFGFGPSRSQGEGPASIASNDSGSPVVLKDSGRVIAVASQSTAIWTSGTILPAISVSTNLMEKSNREFILNHLDQKP